MSDFGIETVVEDTDSDDEWKERRDSNFIETFVEYSRTQQVSNEPQSVVALYGYASGLLPNYEDYLGILIRGGTSSGKSWMKENVLDAAFDYADNEYNWLYTTTGGSDKFFIDDDTFDDARIGAFNEFQQLGSELREFLKRIVEGDRRFDSSEMDIADESIEVYADEWDEAAVTEPLFNFAKSESSRASAAIASMVKASALLNYHSRPTVEDESDGEMYIVAQPQDVGNVLCARTVLLATTHNLTTKKFIVLEAFKADGAPYSGEEASANAKQIEKKAVVNYIQERSDIPTFSKSQISSILDELDEDLVINKMDHPEDARKNIYVYDPSRQFERPATHEYGEQFGDVTDPIRRQPIDTTIDEQLADLDALVSTEGITEIGHDSDSDGLDSYDSGGGELSDDAQLIVDSLADVMDDTWVPANVIESDEIRPLHMIGVTPIETERRSLGSGEDADTAEMIVPERDVQYSDREGTIADPDHEHWGGKDVVAVDTAIDEAIHELRDSGVMDVRTDEMGNGYFTVTK